MLLLLLVSLLIVFFLVGIADGGLLACALAVTVVALAVAVDALVVMVVVVILLVRGWDCLIGFQSSNARRRAVGACFLVTGPSGCKYM